MDTIIPYPLNKISHDVEILQNDSSKDTILIKLITFALKIIMTLGFSQFCFENQTTRNGYRTRTWKLSIGEVVLKIPKARKGYYKPFFEDQITQYEQQALDKLITLLYVTGLTIREIEKAICLLGYKPIKRNAISKRIRKYTQLIVKDFRTKQIRHYYPILYTDALYQTIRYEGFCIKLAVLVVFGLRLDGKKADILDISPLVGESRHTYKMVFDSLKNMGLKSPILVLSDSHKGAKKAIRECFPGAGWQRCAVHLCRDVFKKLPKGLKLEERSAFIKDVSRVFFESESKEQALKWAAEVISTYNKGVFTKAVKVFEQGYMDSLTFFDFKELAPTLIRTTNPIERFNRQIRRRANTSVLYPNIESYLRQIVSYVLEQVDPTLNREYFAGDSLLRAVDEHREMLSDLPEEVSKMLDELETQRLAPEVIPTEDSENVSIALNQQNLDSKESVILQAGKRSFPAEFKGREVNIQIFISVLVDSLGKARPVLLSMNVGDTYNDLQVLSDLLKEKDIRLFCTNINTHAENRMIAQVFPNVLVQSDLKSVIGRCVCSIPKKNRKPVALQFEDILVHSPGFKHVEESLGEFVNQQKGQHPSFCNLLIQEQEELISCFKLNPSSKPVRRMMTISMVDEIFDLTQKKLEEEVPTVRTLLQALISACEDMDAKWQNPKGQRAVNPIHFLKKQPGRPRGEVCPF